MKSRSFVALSPAQRSDVGLLNWMRENFGLKRDPEEQVLKETIRREQEEMRKTIQLIRVSVRALKGDTN